GAQTLGVLAVFKHGRHNRIDGVVGDIFRGDKGSQYAVRGDVFVVIGVQTARNGDFSVVRVFVDQGVHSITRKRNNFCAAGGGGVLDVGGRVTNAVEEAIDLAVAQRRTMLVRTQLGCQREEVHAIGTGHKQVL